MIPEAAVEAAARAVHTMWMAPDGVSWDDDLDAQEAYMSEANVALEAAAPHMRQAFFLEMNLRAVEAELKTPFR